MIYLEKKFNEILLNLIFNLSSRKKFGSDELHEIYKKNSRNHALNLVWLLTKFKKNLLL
jgi:hypothetical protein